jgi:hypothetical protein
MFRRDIGNLGFRARTLFEIRTLWLMFETQGLRDANEVPQRAVKGG